jgi:hypothetical protein
MTLYGNGNNAPIGGPMSPFQGTTPGVSGGAVQQLPAGMSILEALSRGYVSRNSLVNTVNSISTGGDPSKGGDPCTVDQALSNGNGAETARGASVAPAGALNTQILQDGYNGPAQTGNGAIPKNTSGLTEAPVSAATIASNVAVFANGFGG